MQTLAKNCKVIPLSKIWTKPNNHQCSSRVRNEIILTPYKSTLIVVDEKYILAKIQAWLGKRKNSFSGKSQSI